MVKIEVTNNITNKINDFQKKYGSSRTFIANKIGISRQSLNSLESADNPSIQMLERLAFVLECSVDELYQAIVTETD